MILKGDWTDPVFTEVRSRTSLAKEGEGGGEQGTAKAAACMSAMRYRMLALMDLLAGSLVQTCLWLCNGQGC